MLNLTYLINPDNLTFLNIKIDVNDGHVCELDVRLERKLI